MKKIKIFSFIVLLLCLGCLFSCKQVSELNNQDYGKIDYYIAGLYIQVNEYDEFEISDPNPKIYFNFADTAHFGTLTTKSGYRDSAVVYGNIGNSTKNENDVKLYYANVNMNFVNEDVDKITVYLVNVDKNGNLYVNTELSETVSVSSSTTYNFITEFKNNKQKYQLEIKLKINK